MSKLKKTIFTLNVDGYAPEITELTYPLIKRYAEKIGADFHIISERKSPHLPPVYEKLQIYDLGRKMGNDWNIYIDSDAIVHPDFFDVTNFIKKDTVVHNGADMANNRWRYDKYFIRDGRNIGSCNWFAIASDWCLDLWHPSDISFEEARENIFPTQNETNTIITPDHLIDDYTLSRNIAKYGLKFKTVVQIMQEINDAGNYLWHAYTIRAEDKVKEIRKVLANWGISDYKDPKIEGYLLYPELIWLYLTAQKMNSVVEIGSWKGKGSHAIASGCLGKVTLVDNFLQHSEFNPDAERDLRRNISGFKNVEILKMDSIEAAKHFEDNSIDMVFIDGVHDKQSVLKDLNAWYPKCKKILCGHDLDRQSVKDALVEFDIYFEVQAGNIWAKKKTKLAFAGR
ncbi:MAG: class I SAM-dependent methyltransferase [Candidatus Zambryskibacteria bacterium]|nr:class I SAM-dependent methyltransferase [Candidatus Zambryskibacteria bacterium]